ncbi:MAG: hypothetical protein K8J09_12085 [Planctomycetes bacterium]|nr:hypothetical protein [Planctomycetota bacterium]
MNAIQLVGSDFRRVSPSRLEQLSGRREEVQARLIEWKNRGIIRGGLLLATCNRFEVLVELDAPAPGDFARRLLAVDADFPLHEHCGLAAVEHMLGVTAGLHSLAFGEEQILGQVRTAFRAAEEFGMLSQRLHMLCTRLLGTAREVRHRIGLDHKPRSVASLAVEQLMHAGPRLAVIGAGETGRLLLEIMQRRHLPAPLVVNRTLERAEALAVHFGGRAMSLAEFERQRPALDGVVFAVHSPKPIWHAADAVGVRVVVDISQPSVLGEDLVSTADCAVSRLDDFAARALAEQEHYLAIKTVGAAEVKALAGPLFREVADGRPNLGRVVDLHVEGALAELEQALCGKLRHLSTDDREALRGVMLRAAKRNAHHHIRDLKHLTQEQVMVS